MARPNCPTIEPYVRADGTTKYTMRPMVNGERVTIQLGDERDGATPQSVKAERKNILEDIALGRWQPDDAKPASAAALRRSEPGYAEAAEMYLDMKRSRQLRQSTIDRLEWIIETHLVPFFKNVKPSRITEDDVIALSNHAIAQRPRIAALRAEGKYLTGPKGGHLRELSDVTINSLLVVLTGMLDWAAKKGWGDPSANPAAGWRLEARPRIPATLEADELAALIAAAATPRPARRRIAAVAARVDQIVRLRDKDRLPWAAVAALAGVGETTAIYHYQQAKDPTHFAVDAVRALADEAFLTVLGYCGPRVTEVCDLTVAEVDLRHAKFRIPDSKTKAGVREVDMTPHVVEVVSAYFASRTDLAPGVPAFPDGNGNWRNKDQANKQTILPAWRLANELRAECGEPAIPRVTAHSLRHTYITLAFESAESNYSVPYVMQQVGHVDPRTTMKIYAKVSARRNRAAQGAAFDRLVATATAPSATHAGPVNDRELAVAA